MSYSNRSDDPGRILSALEQLEDIQRRIAAQERFHGYRSATVAFTGAGALAAAAWLAVAQPTIDLAGFIDYWLLIAAAAFALCTGDVLHYCLSASRGTLRRQTRAAAAQFLPTLAAGALITMALRGDPRAELLPGLWAIIFGLALLTSRSSLPRGAMVVALCYMAAGASFLQGHSEGAVPNPWFMGIVFGGGHIALACVIYLSQRQEGQGS